MNNNSNGLTDFVVVGGELVVVVGAVEFALITGVESADLWTLTLLLVDSWGIGSFLFNSFLFATNESEPLSIKFG